MKRILIAAAVAMVTCTPLAFAATYMAPPSALTTLHCSYVDQRLAYNQSQGRYASETDYRLAQQQAATYCREDRHKNFDRTGGNVAR